MINLIFSRASKKQKKQLCIDFFNNICLTTSKNSLFCPLNSNGKYRGEFKDVHGKLKVLFLPEKCHLYKDMLSSSRLKMFKGTAERMHFSKSVGSQTFVPYSENSQWTAKYLS